MLRFLFGLFVLILLPHAALAQEGCESYPDVPVTVTPVFEEPSYNFTVNIPGIHTLLNDTRHSIQERHDSLPLGVTHYQPMLEFRLPVKTLVFPDGLSCARVERADVTIGYKDVTVYIAREVPQGTCGFNEIMQHEQKHIAVNQQILQEYTTLIEGSLRDYLRLNGVFREGNPDYALSLLREKLQIILNNLGQKMMDDNRERQRLVDSPQEYKRLTNSCNGQLAIVAESYWNAPR